MSKFSTITAAIEQLEKAEDALLKVSRTFPANSPEKDFLTDTADRLSNAAHTLQHKYLPRVESELLSAAQIKPTK